MSTSKILSEKLAAHPELEKRVSELIELVLRPAAFDRQAWAVGQFF